MDIRNTITRFGATALIGCGLVVTAIPATFAQNDGETVTHEYQDRAASHISEVWYKGETLEISGEGFLTQDRASGSTIAIKLNKGAIKIDGKDYLEVTANDKGEFTVSIPWQSDLEDRVSVDVYLLSGSLKDNDTSRGGKAATVTIKAANESLPTPAPSESTEPTPAPSEDPTPAPSEDSTPAPTTEAPKPAEETSAPAVEDAKETKPAEDQKPAEEQKSEDQKSDQASDSSAKDEKAYKYQNCADVWADRGGPIYKGDPDFREKFDADGDGKGCDEQPNYKNSTSDNDNLGSSSSNDNLDSGSGSSNASSKSSSSLAKTGASGAMTAAGLGLIALGAGGATIVATRMRKKA